MMAMMNFITNLLFVFVCRIVWRKTKRAGNDVKLFVDYCLFYCISQCSRGTEKSRQQS